MIADQQTYGKKIDYNPQWEGPLKIERQQTDYPFLVSLGVYLVLWIGIAMYAFASGDASVKHQAEHLVHEISLVSIFQEAVVLFFPSSLVFPIIPYILYGIVITFTGATYIFLSSLNQQPTLLSRTFHVINTFGFLWLICYITAFSQMILSGSFATYYWTRNKNQVPNNTILHFMGITIRYHLGTIAVGSLIIAICKFIRSLLNIKEDGSSGKCNPIACLCCGCYKYLFGNLERILRYINRNAYIMSSIHGTKYYESAKDAFNLLMRNIMSVLVINKVTAAVLLFGQILVIALSALATYAYCNNFAQPSVTFVAIAMVVLSAIAVTESFFTVLRIAIDTVFLCALEDSERNDGSIERPYFISIELKAVILQDTKIDQGTEENVIY